jgi:hypothetical protein
MKKYLCDNKKKQSSCYIYKKYQQLKGGAKKSPYESGINDKGNLKHGQGKYPRYYRKICVKNLCVMID